MYVVSTHAVPTFAWLLRPNLWRQLGPATLDTAVGTLKIVILYGLSRFLVLRLIDRIIIPIVGHGEKVMESGQAARLRTLTALLKSISSYILTFIFGVMLLRAFGLDPVPLLTTASVAGLAVGFGAQKLVKDVISGFFIILENQYSIGNYVTIGAVTGVVEEIGMRTTRIRDDTGKLYFLSNGDISLVCNQSRGSVSGAIEIGLNVSTDIAKATELINDACRALVEQDQSLGFVKTPEVLGLIGMEGTKLTLRVSCAVESPTHLSTAQAGLRDMIYRRLTESGISLA